VRKKLITLDKWIQYSGDSKEAEALKDRKLRVEEFFDDTAGWQDEEI